MTRSATVVLGDDASGIRMTYVRSRRMLSLKGWQRPGAQSPSIEIPLAELAQRLGFEEAAGAGRPRYLVFAGRHTDPRGGAGDLAGAFDSEERARERFDGLRLRLGRGEGWGELAVLDAWGRAKRLAWFGRDGERSWEPAHTDHLHATVPESQRKRPRRRWGPDVPAQGSHLAVDSSGAGAGASMDTDRSTIGESASASGSRRSWVRSLAEPVRRREPAMPGLQP